MNLEMPSASDLSHLRTLLLIVLGVMIVTIPVVALLVIAKVRAQRRQGPRPEAPAVETDKGPGSGASGNE